MTRDEQGASELRLGTRPGRNPFALWNRLTLWPRLAIAVTLGFLVLFATFGVLALRAVDASTDRILQERLTLSVLLAKEFDRFLSHAFSELAAFDPAGSSAPEQRRLLEQTYERGRGPFATLSLLDRNGNVVVALGSKEATAGGSPESRRSVAAVLATGRRSISAPYWDDRHRPVVALTSPILARAGRLRAILVGTVDVSSPEVMDRLETANSLGRTGHAELVGPGGIALASTEPGEFLTPGEHLDFYRRMLSSQKPAIATVRTTPWRLDATDGRLEDHVMAFARLSVAPWGVTLGGTKTETFAAARRLTLVLSLAAGASLLTLWALTLLGARLLVRPVRVLTLAAENMASGNLEQPISVPEGGEIGVLGESLETMRAQLKDSLETVRRWGEELEHKVEERTTELHARNRQLAAVSAVATAANEAHDLQGVLDNCLDIVLQQMSMDAGAIQLLDPGLNRLAEPVSRGTCPGFPCPRWVRVGDLGCCAAAAAEGAPLGPAGPEQRQPDCPVSADALMILPLRGTKGLLGFLALVRRQAWPTRPDERPVFSAICEQIAVAIESAHLADELRRLEAQQDVQRMRAELVSAVSHELRTPLGFIKGYATTLLQEDTPIEPATRQQFLEIIDEETEKLEHMIDELLDTSRLQAGRLPIERQPVLLGALVAHAVDKARPAIEATGHSVSFRLPDDDVPVLADTVRIEQVLNNLLENAVRYSQRDSPIQVSLTADDGHAFVSVSNRGDGIPQAEQELVFELFERGQSAELRRIRGAGLGLAICRGIVEAHEGRIWVDSTPGKTTTFSFSLPLPERDATPRDLAPLDDPSENDDT
jgi:two-component system sensor histidine kinase KdpD